MKLFSCKQVVVKLTRQLTLIMILRSGRVISIELTRQKIVETGESFCLHNLFRKFEWEFRQQGNYEYGLRRAKIEDMEARISV